MSDVLGADDALGRCIRLHADGVVRTRWTVGGGRTRHNFSPGEDRSAELSRMLRSHLESISVERTRLTPEELAAAPLEDLVTASHVWSHS